MLGKCLVLLGKYLSPCLIRNCQSLDREQQANRKRRKRWDHEIWRCPYQIVISLKLLLCCKRIHVSYHWNSCYVVKEFNPAIKLKTDSRRKYSNEINNKNVSKWENMFFSFMQCMWPNLPDSSCLSTVIMFPSKEGHKRPKLFTNTAGIH